MNAPPIVAAIDFSDSSPLVLRHAAYLADVLNCSLLAVHVVESSRLQHWKASLLHLEKATSDLSEVQARLDALVDEVVENANHEGGVEVETVVTEGRPVDEIQALVAEREATLLIIAANDMTKARLGNISAGCVRKVDCDVLVLRDWQGGAFKRLMVGTDFSAMSGHALERGAQIAALHGAELHLVHVMYPPNKDSWGRVREQALEEDATYEGQCHERAAQAMSEFVNRHAEALKGVNLTTEILVSDLPGAEMTYYMKKLDVDLVLIGTPSLGGLESIFVGTNAERLLHDAPVSVFATRHHS